MIFCPRVGENAFGTHQLVVKRDVPSGDDVLGMSHIDSVFLSQRTVIRQKGVGSHCLEKTYIFQRFGIAIHFVGLQREEESVAEGREDGGVRVTKVSFPEEVVAVESVERVAELHSCGVEGGVPYLVDFYLAGSVVEEEDFFSEYGVGSFLDEDKSFGGGCVGRGNAVVIVMPVMLRAVLPRASRLVDAAKTALRA